MSLINGLVPKSLGEIAKHVAGELQGSSEVEITRVSGLDTARPGDISFLAQARFEQHLSVTKASALFVNELRSDFDLPQIQVANPYLAAIQAHYFIVGEEQGPQPGVHSLAWVDPTAQLGERVHVGPGAVVQARAQIGDRCIVGAGAVIEADVQMGPDCRIHPKAVIRHQSVLSARVIIHSGAVIGADGFGFLDHEGQRVKIPQIGIVRLEEDVEVGANTCIDRATFGETVIGRGSKLDNLVQVGHNVRIGEHSVFAAQVGIAGSARIGSQVMMGGKVGVANGAEVADKVTVAAMSGLFGKVEPGEVWAGAPALPIKTFFRINALLPKLPELFKQVRQLKKRSDQRDS